MTFGEYNALQQHEKYACLLNKATQLMMLQEKDLVFVLYQIDNFYVEIRFDCLKDRIDQLKSFKNTDQLEPYLAEIDISEIKQTLFWNF